MICTASVLRIVQVALIRSSSVHTVQYSTVQCVDLLKEPLVWHRFHTRLNPDHRNAHFGII